MRWSHDRVVSCDGGGGPAGHPRIFINTDKPEITPCGYCGLPFVSSPGVCVLELCAGVLACCGTGVLEGGC
ncbi:zinc-finger domain-containing protein [Candidatus Bathyarchaeota archaeon]|nr:zinc-finger domain-containing protein [Candidatus Bathyarchaeota archaeon]